MREKNKRRYARRVVKAALWVLAGIPLLIILALLVLQIPAVQSSLAQKAVASISAKTHTRIEVGSVSIAFAHTLVLRGIFVEDRRGDTLLSVQTLTADVNLLGLFSHAVTFHALQVDSLTAHITRTLPDSSFNFDFILNALSPGSGPDIPPGSSAEPGWELRLGGVSLNRIHVTYDDEVSGLNLRLQIGSMETSIEEFHPDRMQIRVDEVSLKNTVANIIQTKETPHSDSPSEDLDIGFRAIALANTRVNYENRVTRERLGLDVGNAMVTAEKIDLPSRRITLKEFLLEDTHLVIVEPKMDRTTMDHGHVPARSWRISLDELNLRGNSACFDVQGAPETRGLDLNHLRLDDLTM
ncbi:MAG: AsmA family protein, partial [Bacteroidota bacterium]